MLRTTLIVLSTSALVIGALIGVMFAWVALATADAMVSADKFLSALNEKNGEAAYSMVSQGFRQVQPKERFLREMASLRQATFRLEPWWRQTLPQGEIAVLEVITETGPVAGTSVVLEMIDEGGWKVRTATDWTRFEIGAGAWFRRLPLDDEIGQLVEDTLLSLNEAAATGDFDEFIAKAGGSDEVARSSFVESFDRIVENETDFGDIANVVPRFDGPADWQRLTRCNPFGGGCTVIVTTSIQVSGEYSREPSPLHFNLFYTYAHPNWVLGCAPTVRECTVELRHRSEP